MNPLIAVEIPLKMKMIGKPLSLTLMTTWLQPFQVLKRVVYPLITLPKCGVSPMMKPREPLTTHPSCQSVLRILSWPRTMVPMIGCCVTSGSKSGSTPTHSLQPRKVASLQGDIPAVSCLLLTKGLSMLSL